MKFVIRTYVGDGGQLHWRIQSPLVGTQRQVLLVPSFATAIALMDDWLKHHEFKLGRWWRLAQ